MVFFALGVCVAALFGCFRSDPATRNCRVLDPNRRPAVNSRGRRRNKSQQKVTVSNGEN